MISIIRGAFSKRLSLRLLRRVDKIIQKLNPTEKFIFRVFAVAMIISSITMVWRVNSMSLIYIPVKGGKITEGVVGFPRFVNPLLAVSEADRDLETLIYSGLMKAGQDGSLILDLAENVKISEDGLAYTFKLKEGLTFHDGDPVTTDDILFTIDRALDTAIKSHRRSNWEGVTTEQISKNEVVFKLQSAYAPFLQNTTMGILPKHIWSDTVAEQFSFSSYNIEPIGSGPYKIKNIKRDESGVPTNAQLEAFDNYALGEPFIQEVRFRFYSNEEDLITAHAEGEVDGINSISPLYANTLEEKGTVVERTPLPRIFAVFFNHNQQPLFADQSIRQALSLSLDRQKIVDKILWGYGTPASGPIPAGLIEKSPSIASSIAQSNDWKMESRRTQAATILSDNGWKRNKISGVLEKGSEDDITALSFSLSTSDVPELKAAGEEIKRQWGELGVNVELEIFEIGNLNHNIIRPRKYDSLLFGEIIGRDLDLYAFWHSSQRSDPGLNIALYTNITTDKLLENARKETDIHERIKMYRQFEEEIAKDAPAVFIYTPDFIYVPASKLNNLNLSQVTTPSERFLNIHEWHVEEEGVWPIFIKK